MQITSTTKLVAVEQAGCGHVVYLTAEHNRYLLDHRGKPWFCTVCGRQNYYGGESEAERLKRQLSATHDQLDTMRNRWQGTQRRLRAQKGVTTRIKNRVGRGVCPCCNRTFKDLARHMENQHPEFVEAE